MENITGVYTSGGIQSVQFTLSNDNTFTYLKEKKNFIKKGLIVTTNTTKGSGIWSVNKENEGIKLEGQIITTTVKEEKNKEEVETTSEPENFTLEVSFKDLEEKYSKDGVLPLFKKPHLGINGKPSVSYSKLISGEVLDLDEESKEEYLNHSEFEKMFEMSHHAYSTLVKYKQKELKKKLKL
jgi:hypothetical protein